MITNSKEELQLLYTILRMLKMKKELPAWITWVGNEIFVNVNHTMLYHLIIENMFHCPGAIMWQELEALMAGNINMQVNNNVDVNLMTLYTHYKMATMQTTPFYTSDSFKEDINNMGLKAADGMQKLKINPNCFISVFNGIISANKGDDVFISLYLPDDYYWKGSFISKVEIHKKKGNFSYEQFFNSLLV